MYGLFIYGLDDCDYLWVHTCMVCVSESVEEDGQLSKDDEVQLSKEEEVQLSKEDEKSIIDFILKMPQYKEGDDKDKLMDEEADRLMTDFLSSYCVKE